MDRRRVVVTGLGAGKRPPVRVTINGYTYRNTVAVMGGVYMVGVSAEHRAAAGLSADDRGRLHVDEAFRTTVPHILAAGDVIGYPSLVPGRSTPARPTATSPGGSAARRRESSPAGL